MRKISWILMICCLALILPQSVFSATTVPAVAYCENKIYVSGKLDNSYAGKEVNMVFAKFIDGVDAPQAVGYVGSKIVSNDGSYNFQFKYTGETNGYSVKVNQGGIVDLTNSITHAKIIQDLIEIKLSVRVDGNIAKTAASIENIFSATDIPYTLFIASYDANKKIVDLMSRDKIVGKDSVKDYLSIALKENVDTIKVFAWASKQTPLSIHGEARNADIMANYRVETGYNGIRVSNLKTEYKENPIGIKSLNPRMSWEIKSDLKNQKQSAYQIFVLDNLGNPVWDTGKVPSLETVCVEYGGDTIENSKCYYWMVRVWDQDDKVSMWSDTASWEMALENEMDWDGAQWIKSSKLPSNLPQYGDKTTLNGIDIGAAPYLRTTFEIDNNKQIKQARAYVTGLGYDELYINGSKIGDNVVMSPITSNTTKSVYYSVYDITDDLTNGKNAIGALLGRGYQQGYYADTLISLSALMHLSRNKDGQKFLMKVEIEYNDGSTDTITSNTNDWKCENSPILFDHLFYGEYYDARKEIKGWSTAEYDDSNWARVNLAASPGGVLKAQLPANNGIIERIKPKSVTEVADGIYLFDMGRVLTGWARINVRGSEGDKITLQYAERLNSSNRIDRTGQISSDSRLPGDWFVNGLNVSGQSDYYILNGADSGESWAARFVFKSFRYIEVSGFSTKMSEDEIKSAVTAESVAATFDKIGSFNSSENTFNTIHKMFCDTLMNNMHGYPTDTPIYENLGYMADAYLTSEAAMFNYDIGTYYEKWITDMADSVSDDGLLLLYAPVIETSSNTFPAPEWKAASIGVPWNVYTYMGNKKILSDNYELMKKVFEYESSNESGVGVQKDLSIYTGEGKMLLKKLPDNIWWGYFADHVPPVNIGDRYRGITATAYIYQMAEIMYKTAVALDKSADAAVYYQRMQDIKTAFNTWFWDEEKGYYHEGKLSDYLSTYSVKFGQTPNLLALNFGLCPDEATFKKVSDNLLANIDSYSSSQYNAIGTGIIGTKYLFSTLTDLGYGQQVYNMLTSEKYPGYGYWLANGATSCWEYWDKNKRSENHCAFGVVDEYYYKYLAGIKNDGVGYSQSTIKPYVIGDLTEVKAEIQTIRGKIASSWSKGSSGYVNLSVTVPTNTTSSIYVPLVSKTDKVFEGNKLAVEAEGVLYVGIFEENGYLWAEYTVGSGNYTFTVGAQ